MLQVPHLGSPHLNVPNQAIGEATKPQPKPQVEQEKVPQPQVKINHDDQVDDLKMMKKKQEGVARQEQGIQLTFNMPRC